MARYATAAASASTIIQPAAEGIAVAMSFARALSQFPNAFCAPGAVRALPVSASTIIRAPSTMKLRPPTSRETVLRSWRPASRSVIAGSRRRWRRRPMPSAESNSGLTSPNR